jgi:RND family efflux transporter MFP subunit
VSIGKDKAALRHLRTLFNVGTIRELTDGQLLERFATDRGEAAELAFAVLVERHGAMVWRVCRSVLDDPHDTEDAFQATFLVLVKKATGLWVADSLGPWLHQVAYRTASCARSSAARRRRLERMAAATNERRDEARDEVATMLHEEIERLPERYRAPLVLCDLEGRTHEQAARHLGWAIGTVKSRQSRGRERLRDRLRRRGLAPTSSSLATALGSEMLLPPALVESTTRTAVQFVTARTIVRTSAALLAQGVLKSMFITRWLKLASVVLAVGATTSGVELLAQKGTSDGQAEPEQSRQADRGEDTPVFAVKPGKFRSTVVDRGYLEASRAETVYAPVEGIVRSIVPEGTHVKKGQLVCELESSPNNNELVNQVIASRSAEAAYVNAKNEREVAEMAAIEYSEGISRQQEATLMGEQLEARSAMERAKARLERTGRARKKLNDVIGAPGRAITPTDIMAELDVEDRLEAADQALARAKTAFELAQTKRRVLVELTNAKRTKELKGKLESARANELAKEQSWQLEKSMEAKLRKQVEDCKIYAPDDGVLVLANDPNRTTSQPQIVEGAMVRERQLIFTLVDTDKPMQVNAKVREAMIDRITRGQTVQIKVDAFPEETQTGVVRTVAPLPDPPNIRSDRKVYSTIVALDKALPSLRPGMTAEVQILVKELDDVLFVPVTAVLPPGKGGAHYVAVKKTAGGVERREVTLGYADDTFVEVKKGLRSGETVAMPPPLELMSDAEKREKFRPPAKPSGKRK